MSNPKKKWVNSVFRQISTQDCNADDSPRNRFIRRHCSDPTLPYPEPIKKATTSNQSTSNNTTALQENWLNIFAPKSSDELAVHLKKIKELQQWLVHCQERQQRKQPAQLCILTGPSGCGKTTTVQVLAKEFGYHIQEWVNPLDQDVVYNLGDTQSSYYHQHHHQSINNTQIDLLKNFLFKASRYKSILESSRQYKCLLMMEDFPNFLIKDPIKFQEILQEYRDYGKSPWIFVVTDSKSRQLNINYTLFTDQIKSDFLIHQISFNAVATTLMEKAMKRFVNIMRSPELEGLYKTPSDDILHAIISSSQGDIRNAMINLHYMALKGSRNDIIGNQLERKNINEPLPFQNRKSRKKLNTENNLENAETITAMHALGRVFNPKYKNQSSRLFVHNPELITETLHHEPHIYIELLQTNYVEHYKQIENIAEAAEGLSLSEILLNEYRDHTLAHIALNLAVRSLMVKNKEPASGWLPIKPYKRIPSHVQFIPNQHKPLLLEHHNIPKHLYVIDYSTHIKILSQNFPSN